MFEANASGTLHYVCHVGHTWSPQSLIQAQRESSEAALYNAASKLLEEAAVFGRLAELAESEGEIDTALGDIERLRREAEAARKRATTIQEMIRGDGGDASSGAE
jgi:two-component system chemotaxis response regulator CheB